MKKLKSSFKNLDYFSLIISSLITIVLIVIEQVTKLLARTYIEENKPIIIIKNVLDFNLIYNKGAGYGSFSTNYPLLIFFTILGLVVVIYLFLFVSLKKKRLYTTGVIFLLSGALSNAIDRIFFEKGVTDFIEFPFLQFTKLGEFTANVADIFVTIGFILFILHILIIEIKLLKEKKKNKEKK